MKQPETLFKEKVVRKLKAIPNIWWVKVQQVGLRGTPDLLICVNGFFVAWELKVPPNKVKPGTLQHLALTMIEKAGGYSAEVTPQNLDAHLSRLWAMSERRTAP